MPDNNQQLIQQSLELQNSVNNTIGMNSMTPEALSADLVAGRLQADDYLRDPDANPTHQSELNLTQEELNKQYMQQLEELSPCKDTLPALNTSNSDWMRLPAEEVMNKRIEFNEIRSDLKEQWSAIYDREWPQYDKDIYSDSGNLIRRAGNDYDAHHIRPLCLGGENTAANITPMHASVHYDKQGIHAPGSPFDLMSNPPSPH